MTKTSLSTLWVNKHTVAVSNYLKYQILVSKFFRSLSLEALQLDTRDDHLLTGNQGGILTENQGGIQGENQGGIQGFRDPPADLVYPPIARRGLTNPSVSPSPNLQLDGNSTPED